MSVVLVVFPGGPSINEEAQKADRELNQLLEKKTEGMKIFLKFNSANYFLTASPDLFWVHSNRLRIRQDCVILLLFNLTRHFFYPNLEIFKSAPESTIADVMHFLSNQEIENLPPGGGLEGK